MAIISLKNSSLFNTAKGFAFQKTTGAVPLLPTLTFTSATTTSYTIAITGYDAQFTYTVSASAGTAVRTGSNVTVSGLSANQSSTLTVTAANPDASKGISLSSSSAFVSLPATPTLSRSGGTTTTVTVAIGNYDAGLTYTIGSTVGSATRSGSTITVTGLTQGQAVTVTATASNASGNSAQGSLATGAVPATPTLSFSSSTETTATFSITNYNAAYTYSVSSSSGSASRSGSTITVTGLAENTSVTAFATATANGIASAQGSASGTTLLGGAYEQIATVNLSSTTSTIQFTSIPQGYRSIQIRGSAISSSSGNSMIASFNSDSSNIYTWGSLIGYASNGKTYSSSWISSSFQLSSLGNSSLNQSSAIIMDIYNYSSTSIKKSYMGIGGRTLTGFDRSVQLDAGTYESSTAVTSITLSLGAASFTAGTKLSLYGVK